LKNRLNNKNKIDVEGVPKMDRVPSIEAKWFMDYSHSYFCGDYGMCFKHIIDNFRGMTPVGYEELQEQIDELKSRIVEQPKEPEGTKMADGTVRG